MASGAVSAAERQALQSARELLSKQQEADRQLAQLLGVFAPGLGDVVTYRPEHNMFTGDGYESAAGNIYFSALQMSASIAIKTDIGIGHTHRFLNELYIFTADGKRQMLAHRSYNCCYYSKHTVRHEAVRLMTQAILDAAPAEARAGFAEYAALLAERCVAEAFDRNQLEVLGQNLKGLP